jgi:hypothetical protein
MKGDFSRVTFDPDPLLRYSRVLEQQGRVRLDADSNEQTASLLYYLRALAADLIGPHAGVDADAFAISAPEAGDPGDFVIAPGRYYVGGLLAENAAAIPYSAQRGIPFDATAKIGASKYLVYLDVWERFVTTVEAPEIAEVALGGYDTAARAQIVWQVRLVELKGLPAVDYKADYDAFLKVLHDKLLVRPGSGTLAASLVSASAGGLGAIGSRYRGGDNQLYRVEIHEAGTTWTGSGKSDGAATVKWSRENASVAFPVVDVAVDATAHTTRVRLAHLGVDRRLDVEANDWVELVDDDVVLRNQASPLLKVKHIDREGMRVTLDGQAPAGYGDVAKRPLLRRWDHAAGPMLPPNAIRNGALILQADAAGKTMKLEQGLQIRFAPDARYETGDYWLVPARTTGAIEWPRDAASGDPKPVPAGHGEKHRYAPLAVVDVAAGGGNPPVASTRRVITPVAK